MIPKASSSLLAALLAVAAVPAATSGVLLAGCAPPQTRRNLNYGDRARAEYEQALARMNSGDSLDAEERFRRIRRQYGLSRWAWLAELRLADLDFRQERFSQAITGYRAWIRYHPTQPEVPYAHYMIARCYFSEIPSDWFLVPASWERDQSSTHDAEEQFEHFLQDYGDSRWAPSAREYLRRTRELLARAEIHVAQYYLSRERPEAAISRLRGVLEQYAGSGLEAEALLRMGETYLQMGRRREAAAAFNAIVARFPRASEVASARRYLTFIGPIAGPPAPSPVPDPASLPPPPPAS